MVFRWDNVTLRVDAVVYYRVIDTFVELADTMVADFDVIDFLHLLTSRSAFGAPNEACPALLARQFAARDQVTHERTASAWPWPGDSRTSSAVIIPRVSVTLLAAPVLDCGSDVPYTYLERERVLLVHAAQLVHERGRVSAAR